MGELNSKDLSEMVLRLAHGIRNPLATIKTGVQLVKHLSDPNEEVEEYLDSALDGVDRIDLIIRDVQRYVKIAPIRPEKISVSSIINEITLEMEPLLKKKEIALRSFSGESCSIFVDYKQMLLTIKELLNNAIEHSPQGSTISISWDKNKKRQVYIHVEDACGGVKPETEQKIMRPFFSTSRVGTGLGLNIVAKFLEVSGGNLNMSPKVNKGCRFTIMLPEV